VVSFGLRVQFGNEVFALLIERSGASVERRKLHFSKRRLSAEEPLRLFFNLRLSAESRHATEGRHFVFGQRRSADAPLRVEVGGCREAGAACGGGCGFIQQQTN
jgi:hypothetical protein